MKSYLLIIFFIANILTGSIGAMSNIHYGGPQDKQASCPLNDRLSLIKRAEKKFGKLTDADEILFAAVADSNWADYTKREDRDKTEDVNNKGVEWAIDANRIEWLCYDKQAKELVTDRGIWIKRAKIFGAVNLDYAEIPFPLHFQECVFNKEINMNSTRIKSLVLTGSHTGSIRANGIKVEAGVFLKDDFKANGEVIFTGATINGDFDCTGGNFINKDSDAILADGADINGSVFLSNRFTVNGKVSFLCATIGEDLDCTNGEFINEDSNAIVADRVDINGSVFLCYGFKANGKVSFLGATINGDFVCINGEFINQDSNAILADGADINGSVFLGYGFKSNGKVSFLEATINGDFDCTKGEFINKDSNAILASGIDINGSVFLSNGCKINGKANFLGATIGGDFDCIKGEFINEDSNAISVERSDIKSTVFLCNGFKVNGGVNFYGATIGGDFDCTKGEFINKNGEALSASGIIVKGAVYFENGFKAEGLVNLEGAFAGEYLSWNKINLTEKTSLDLRNAKTGVLWDDDKSWPGNGKLFLDGFQYDEIGNDALKNPDSRVRWIQKQYDPNMKTPQFRPQPYEQLAAVFQKSGYQNDAKQVLIHKSKDRIKWGPNLTFSEFLWYQIFGRIICYGHKPVKALWFVLITIVLGWILFYVEHRKNPSINSEQTAVPEFNSLIYAIDTFVPLIDLNQAKHWWPKRSFFRIYYWLHIGCGWILTTLLVVGLTGIIRK